MWDIGANVGFYSLFASQFVGSSGRVLAFDTEPSCRERLRENLELNRVANVSILPFALGQKSGEHLLCVVSGQPAAGSHHLLAPGAQPGPSEETVVVQVLRGDEACTKHNLPIPNVIKIDVEGFELDVIKGLRSILSDPTCTTVLTEVHFSVLEQRGEPFAPLEVADTLSGFGFGRQRWLDRSHLLASKGLTDERD